MFGSHSIRQLARRSQSIRLAQRSVALVAAVMYFVVASGVPLPVASQSSKSGELFPCASSGCGCDSAEKCWRSCCCHSLAERLAWAEKNGVEPPAFALAEAARAELDSTGRRLTPKIVNVALAKTSDCQAKQRCCSSAKKTPSCCASHDESHDEDQATNFVVAWRALGCHGQSLNWLAAVPSLISIELTLSDQLPLAAWLGPHSSDIAAGVSDVPTPPPPKCA